MHILTEERERELVKEARTIFGQRLGLARASIYPDQDDAGGVLGLKPRRWGGWERGRTEPPLWVIRRLPAMFHRPLSWFFDLPDERGLNDKEGQIIMLLRSLDDPVIRDAAADGTIRQLERQIEMETTLREREGQSVSR